MRRELILQRLLKPCIRGLFRLISRVRVRGVELLPPSPPYIVCSNHISWFDPPLVGSFLPGRIYIMAMEGLFRFKPLGFLLRLVGAIPVNRSGLDRRAIEEAMDSINSGGILLIFPEGGIRRMHRGEELRPGVSLIAQRTNVPLVPVGIRGCRDLYHPLKLLTRRVTIDIRIGQPFLISSFSEAPGKKTRLAAMARIAREMSSLAEKAAAGAP